VMHGDPFGMTRLWKHSFLATVPALRELQGDGLFLES
jgi:hypothetical protein